MSLSRKLCWLSLSVALVAAALLVTACGGDGEESPTTPSAGATDRGRRHDGSDRHRDQAGHPHSP